MDYALSVNDAVINGKSISSAPPKEVLELVAVLLIDFEIGHSESIIWPTDIFLLFIIDAYENLQSKLCPYKCVKCFKWLATCQ